jgi:hypothetical protein
VEIKMLKELEKEEEEKVLRIVNHLEQFVNERKKAVSIAFLLRNFLKEEKFVELPDQYFIYKIGLSENAFSILYHKIYYWIPEDDGCREGYGVYYSWQTNYYYFFYGRYYNSTKQYTLYVKKLSEADLKKWITTNVCEGKQLK